MLLGLSTQALADHYDPQIRPVYDYAKVCQLTPIVRYVTVTTPVKECWEEMSTTR